MVNVLGTCQIFPVFKVVPVALNIALEFTARNDSSFNRFRCLAIHVSSCVSCFWSWSSSSRFATRQIVSAACLVFFKDWLLISCDSSSCITCLIGCALISFCRSYSCFCDDKLRILIDSFRCASWGNLIGSLLVGRDTNSNQWGTKCQTRHSNGNPLFFHFMKFKMNFIFHKSSPFPF